MGAPLELQQALREGEQEAIAAGRAEHDACETAATLRQELDELHSLARVDLQERNAELAVMQAQVDHVQRYTQDIGQTLHTQQSFLRSHRARIDERYYEERVRELQMLSNG